MVVCSNLIFASSSVVAADWTCRLIVWSQINRTMPAELGLRMPTEGGCEKGARVGCCRWLKAEKRRQQQCNMGRLMEKMGPWTPVFPSG